MDFPALPEAYPDKQATIVQNKNKKIGSENTFFPLLDLADIDFKGNDLTKVSPHRPLPAVFKKYFNNNDQKGHFYKDFDTIIQARRR